MNSRFILFKNSICNQPNVTRSKFLEGDRLLCLIKLSKFDRSKKPYATAVSLLEHGFGRSTFILLIQMFGTITMDYGLCSKRG